jgi:hypothetical protein
MLNRGCVPQITADHRKSLPTENLFWEICPHPPVPSVRIWAVVKGL